MTPAPSKSALRRLGAERSRPWIGAALVAGGAMLFALKGVFAKQLYAQQVGFELLSTVRAVIALPLFWAFAIAREGTGTIRRTPPRALLAAAAAGFLCYYVGTLLDFYALTIIDAGIERALLFSYPAMVVVITAALAQKMPARSILMTLLMTYAGIFFVVGGFDTHELRANLLGALFVIATALTYAIYFLLGARFTREIGSVRFTLFAMSAAAIALCVHFVVTHDFSDLYAVSGRSWVLLLVLGVVCMFVPALMQAEGMRRIGAERGSLVSTVGPPTTILLGWLFLGERLSTTQLLGVALILSGVLSLELARSKAAI